jgi:isopentenyl diphosphate isomerase/L-lactate dehydrogenase-like FMN-dependent dehydrogenase
VPRGGSLQQLRTIDAIGRAARKRLPRGLFEFIDRGTEDELALARDRAAYDRILLRPRVLRGVADRTSNCVILGHAQSAPIAIAPTGAAGLVWLRGEVGLARAAAKAGVPFTLATRAMSSIDVIAAEAGGSLWLQLYPSADRIFNEELMRRAQSAGYQALVVTVDTPIPPRRDYNIENGFSIPFAPSARALFDIACHPRWLLGVIGAYLRSGGLPRLENMPGRPRVTEGATTAAMLDGSLTFDDLASLRESWQGRFIVKGILDPRDAARVVSLGADAVVVSTHGGRNLDAAPAPIDALPSIVAEVGGRAEIFVDGGIRRGSDIVKALALGAKAVMVGRATLYGAAIGGEDGVAQVLAILRDELLYTMAMVGCARVDEIDAEIAHCAPEFPFLSVPGGATQ